MRLEKLPPMARRIVPARFGERPVWRLGGRPCFKPCLEKENWLAVSPDWICEVLSPRTIQTDKTKKMPIYAKHNVRHVWLMDPVAKTLDVFAPLPSGGWELVGSFAENDTVVAVPFHEIEIHLSDLWGF
jgi:Uma2 family endonuclease